MQTKKRNSYFYLFIVAVAMAKLVLMGLFSSDYQDQLFLPFVSDFISQGGNVYQRFYDRGMIQAFPYPIVMLGIQALGGLSVNIFAGHSTFWTNFWFKIPSFLIDLIGLCVLIKFCPEKRRYIAVLYYASPIVFYSVYMHGQLDLIPTVMIISALYFLTSQKDCKIRYGIGGLLTAFALLCKLHILAILPIIFLYIQKRDGLRQALTYAIGVFGVCAAGIAPVWSEGFREMVLFNAEQSVLTQVFFKFATIEVYIPIVAVLFIYLVTYKVNTINRELFLNLCGITFAVFLALCPPMPGWYVWVVPFVCLFFASIDEEKYKNIVIYAILNAVYLVYFVVFHHKGLVDLYFLKMDLSCIKVYHTVVENLIFTLLSGTLIYLVISMYQLGVASNNLYKRKNIPFTIGITGDSGAGKSTMIEVLERGLGAENLQYIEGDGDHRWERGNQLWDEYTALNPKANYLYRQAKDLEQLRVGSTVRRVDYDHSTGKFTKAQKVKAKKYVLLCGLHAMYLPQTRKNLDLKIYLDSDETLRRYWKIQRDTTHRGYTKEAVLASIEKRMPDAEKYIYPQKNYADLIVRYYDKNLTDCMVENYEVNLSVQLTISAAIDVEPLAKELEAAGISVEYEYSQDLQSQYIILDADNLEKMTIPINEIAKRVIWQLDEITQTDLSSDTISAKDGIIILFLLLLISNKMQGVL